MFCIEERLSEETLTPPLAAALPQLHGVFSEANDPRCPAFATRFLLLPRKTKSVRACYLRSTSRPAFHLSVSPNAESVYTSPLPFAGCVLLVSGCGFVGPFTQSPLQINQPVVVPHLLPLSACTPRPWPPIRRKTGVATRQQIPYKVGAPRPGDLACVYADPAKALEDLEWKAQYGLDVRKKKSKLPFSPGHLFGFIRHYWRGGGGIHTRDVVTWVHNGLDSFVVLCVRRLLESRARCILRGFRYLTPVFSSLKCTPLLTWLGARSAGDVKSRGIHAG